MIGTWFIFQYTLIIHPIFFIQSSYDSNWLEGLASFSIFVLVVIDRNADGNKKYWRLYTCINLYFMRCNVSVVNININPLCNNTAFSVNTAWPGIDRKTSTVIIISSLFAVFRNEDRKCIRRRRDIIETSTVSFLPF